MPSDSDPTLDSDAAVRRLFFAPLFILLMGTLITIFLYFHLNKHENHNALNQAAGEFKNGAHDRIRVIKKGIHHGIEGVNEIAALFLSNPGVDRTSFSIFSQNIIEDHPTTQALEWIPRVPATEQKRYEDQARKFFPNFRITQRGQDGQMEPVALRKEYFPVYFVEPYVGNEAALGFDLGSDATRSAALEYSGDNNHLAVSGRITLVQEKSDQFGFLAIKPIYQSDAAIETVAQRRRHLRGYALGVFRIGELVENALDQLKPRGIDIWIFDDLAPAQTRLLYWHGSRAVQTERVMPPIPQKGLHEAESFDVGNRHWRIYTAPAPGKYQPALSSLPKMVLWSGLLLSSLLAFYSHVQLRHTARLKRTMNSLGTAEATQRLLYNAIEASSNGVMITNVAPDGHPVTIHYINPAFTSITGYAPEEALGRSPTFLQGKDRKQASLIPIRAALRRKQKGHAIVRNYRKDGTLFWNDLSIAPVIDEQGDVNHYIGIVNDITERKCYEEQLEYQASYDPLTGLVNRNLLLDRIEQTIAHGVRYTHKVAVVFLDLDRFKTINDALDLKAGDQALKKIAQRLRRRVRNTDTLARIVSDEFVFVLSEITDSDNVVRIAEHLLAEIARPLCVDEQKFQLTASIGISLYPEDGDDGETLLKHADMAMQRAKESGRNSFHFFTEELNTRVMEHLTLEADLRQALEHDEFRLYYQPQVDLYTGRIIGMESLIRWQHPRMGMVPPNRFISLAEKTGYICQIGEWVLNTACRQAKVWQDKGLPAVTVSINLSADQLKQENLVEKILNAVEKNRLAPQQLDLEITESMAMENPKAIVAVLDALKEAGLSLSMDDFGTGYSSLAYLRRFPFDTLKIDRSFVIGITEAPEQAAIVLAVLSLAKSLNLKVVAEGVETQEQQDYLRRRGCDTIQGYYFSPPVPAAEATQLLRQDRRLTFSDKSNDNDRTLLIVDDEHRVIKALKHMLRKEGYRILTAADPRDGLRLLAKEEVGVVLSDQRMPVMSGVEFLTRVKELHPHTVRIAMSGYSDIDQVIAAINKGAIYKFLTKPWEESHLREHLREGFMRYEMINPSLKASSRKGEI